jgi:UDP-glucose 4-epimerase
VDGDIRDLDCVRAACRGVEVVLHQAAIASVPQSIATPALTHTVNVDGTLNVLLAARAHGVRRVVFASSSAVYGDHPASPKAETLPTRPLSPYGVQKLAAEAYLPVWNTLYGVEAVALRYFNVFGPDQDPHGAYAAVIPVFIMTALAGRPPVIYGDGEQSRDFIHIDDVVDVNLLAATVPAAAGQIMNVGTGRGVTLNRLAAELGRVLDREVVPEYYPARPGDIRESLADISCLQTTLDYAPVVSFADGLARTVEGYKRRLSGGRDTSRC